MKIIDILNEKIKGTLEDGFKFIYDNEVYKYDRTLDSIIDKNKDCLGENIIVENF